MEGNCELQKTEIDKVKETFEGNVKVISGIGEFTHVVTISQEQRNLHCKFQLTADYPQTLPTISIRSNGLDSDITASLASHLQNEATEKLGQSMLVELMMSCNQWLKDNEIDIPANIVTEKTKTKKSGPKNNNTKKSKSENEIDDSFKKKPPMKTAADVIKRIQWDKSLDKNDFIVGYMDRIVGLVEKAFTAFTWEDLASVDMFSLAIPQHRIQYFKYKTVKVWDKNDRLDNVFGSTGSKTTIIDAIKTFEDKLKEQQSSDNTKETDVTLHPDSMETEACGENVIEECDSNKDQQAEVVGEEMATSGRRSFRPNYFTAIQLTDANTRRNLVDVQNKILSSYPQYESFKIPPNGFHLTLNILLLKSPNDIDVCIDAVEKARSELRRLAAETEPLKFEGIDQFNSGKVIFAKVIFSQEFRTLVDKINEILDDAGVCVDVSSFIPHITLFKVGKRVSWKRNAVMLTHYASLEFGFQTIDNIQVCRMGTLPDDPESSRFYSYIAKVME